MKKIRFVFIFSLSLNIYSQEIEKMDKKELRVAYNELNLTKNKLKDSLMNKLGEVVYINKQQILETNNLNQLLTKSKQQINEKESKINDLQKIIEAQNEKIKFLSIKPLKLNTFSKIPDEFKKNCGIKYSESKKLFQIKEFILFENKDLNQCLIYLDEEPIFINFKEDIEVEDQIPSKIYSNDNINIKISNQEDIGSSESIFIYKAVIIIKKNDGQEIKINVYGEGGC